MMVKKDIRNQQLGVGEASIAYEARLNPAEVEADPADGDLAYR